MRSILVVGTGYVGLVTGACFAKNGNKVFCHDTNSEKIQKLRRGVVPFFEPGLEELVRVNIEQERLHFTNTEKELDHAINSSTIAFVCVGTPVGENSLLDLSQLRQVLTRLSKYGDTLKLVVIKCTVTAGTLDKLSSEFPPLNLANNPEFLKEGRAIEDFERPDRVVVGVNHEDHAVILRELYEPFLRSNNPFIVVPPTVAELGKIASNAFLANRISLVNEVAEIAEKINIHIGDVFKIVGSDKRIGASFLHAGLGWGGSCFPKDTSDLANTSRDLGGRPLVIEASISSNKEQTSRLFRKIEGYYSSLRSHKPEKKATILGLSFKPETDDVRDAPSLKIVRKLLDVDFTITAHDPKATLTFSQMFGVHKRLSYASTLEEALRGTTIVVICTEWGEYRTIDLPILESQMVKTPGYHKAIFDGRNVFSRENVREISKHFHYFGVGRPYREPDTK